MAKSCLLSLAFRLLLLLVCSYHIHGDVYMHNPRGSNDRLNSPGQNRQNGNRLFDSQNNAKGGYNVGELPYHNGAHQQDLQYSMKYFMSGSKFISSPKKAGKSHLVIEWTSQHGCGHGDLDCNVVLQYMCQNDQFESFDRRKASIDTIRNGKTEGTIPYRAHSDGFLGNPENKKNVKKQASRLEFGMHEPWEWYDKCYRRPRNKGLFTADQNVKDDQGSTATRQDPNGGNAGRNGYECPEERDYFPYWHPSDWKDIAVYVTNKEHCDFYKHFSFNRHPKGECLEKYNGGEKFKHYSRYNNPTDCKANGKDWIVFRSFIDIKDEYKNKASCEQATTKDVPLVWGVPYKSELVDSLELDPVTKKPKEFCLVQPPELDCKVSPVSRPNHLGNVVDSYAMNYTWIIPYFPSQNQKRCVVRIRYNISTYDYDGNKTFSDKNGAQNSPVTNDPKVAFKNDLGNDFDLQLAVNTAQFGRTFQDRSHVMILMARTNKISDDVAVYNLNVRGKRGNIVQVYPAVEYDFVPKSLYVTSDDIVHIQWTGSTRNPGNNDGEGRAGTDKNNMVEIDDSGTNVKFKENSQMIRSATLKWTPDIQLKTMEDVAVALATSGFDFTGGKNNRLGVSENRRLNFQNQLDNSPASFGTALSFAPGSYKYMCTRNNNFSNRNQKGTIIVTAGTNKPSPGNNVLGGVRAPPGSNSVVTSRPAVTTPAPTTRSTTTPAPPRRRRSRRRRIRRRRVRRRRVRRRRRSRG